MDTELIFEIPASWVLQTCEKEALPKFQLPESMVAILASLGTNKGPIRPPFCTNQPIHPRSTTTGCMPQPPQPLPASPPTGLRIVAPEGFTERVQALFNSRASNYDSSDTFHRRLAMDLLHRAAIQPHERVLDIATGTGMVALEAAGVAEHVVGIDLSPGMIEEATAKAAALSLSNCDFLVGPVMEADFADASFDVVTCSSAMVYFADIPATLQRIHRWLKPGGRLAFNTPKEPCIPATLTFYRLFAAEFNVLLLDAAAPLSSVNVVRDALLAAGYRSFEVSTKPESMLFPHTDPTGYAEKLWRVMLVGNAFQPISELMDPAACERFKPAFLREVSASAAAWQSSKGVNTPYELIWAVATA